MAPEVYPARAGGACHWDVYGRGGSADECTESGRLVSSDRCNLSRPAVFLGGYGRFVAVTAEAFAASRRSWRRSLPLRGGHGGGLLYIDTKTTQKIASHATSAFFITGTCLGFAPLHGTCAVRRFFGEIIEKKKKKKEKSHLHWPWAVVMWRSSPRRLGGHGGLLRTRPVVYLGGLSWFFNLAVKTP